MQTIWKGALAALLLAVIVRCGGDNPPPPPPVTPPPAPTPEVGGTCGGLPSGQPIRPDASGNAPYVADLYPRYQRGAVNSLQLQLVITRYGDFNHSIAGAGNLALGDLLALFPQSPQQGVTTNFCVSSVLPQGGIVTQGTYDQRSNRIALTLQGTAQLPLINYSPFGGQPTTAGTQPVPVTVDVYGELRPGQRLGGQVIVTLGTGPQAIQFQYQAY